ncbi:MAG: DHHA1 domain-containing protein [Nanoarchaeota archaeon]
MKRFCYHHDDEDGWMSAAILKQSHPETELQSCHHSDEIAMVSDYDEVYVFDFAFSDEEFAMLARQNKQVIWIDHHQMAIERVSADLEGIRDSSRSACALTWMYFHPDETIPRSILHIEDVDLWNFKLDNTQAFFSYIQSKLRVGEEVDLMKSLLDDEPLDYEKIYDFGRVISEFEYVSLRKLALKGVKRRLFDGVPCILFFASRGVSRLGNIALEEYDDVDVAVMIRLIEREDGGIMYSYSLRSRKKDGVDVASIACEYGGGGHSSAAGFIADKLIL